MSAVFISYASADRHTAELLRARLQEYGIDVWIDRDIDAGEPWSATIETALASARCVIVLWSPASVSSTWVLREARFADREETLLPVVIGGARPPLEFDHLQTLDLMPWNGDPAAAPFTELLSAIEKKTANEPARVAPVDSEPLRLLDLADGHRMAGAPEFEQVLRDLRRGRRWNRLAALAAWLIMFAIAGCIFSTPRGRQTWLTRAGILLLIPAGCAVMILTMRLFTTTQIAFPGVPAERDEPPEDDRIVRRARGSPPLLFVTEDVECASGAPGKWDLTIFFSVFNTGDDPITLYDVHANVYVLTSGMEGLLAVTYSESMAIYETNSTLRSGRRITLRPGESQSVRLRLQVAKSVSGAITADQARAVTAVFGLFADAHVQRSTDVLDYRVPSDALYCFSGSDGRFFFLTRANISTWLRKAPSPSFALRLADLLRRHIRAVSLLGETNTNTARNVWGVLGLASSYALLAGGIGGTAAMLAPMFGRYLKFSHLPPFISLRPFPFAWEVIPGLFMLLSLQATFMWMCKEGMKGIRRRMRGLPSEKDETPGNVIELAITIAIEAAFSDLVLFGVACVVSVCAITSAIALRRRS